MGDQASWWCSRSLSGAALTDPARRWIVIDTETTGLQPRSDCLLEFAAIVLDDDGRILRRCSWRESDGSAELGRAVGTLEHDVSRGVVVAHNVAFDLTMLRADARTAAAAVAMPARWLCTMRLTGARTSLDSLCQRLGVTPSARHSARGDATTTATILVRLLAAARERRLETIGGLAVVTPPVRSTAPSRAPHGPATFGWPAARAQRPLFAPLPPISPHQRRALADACKRLSHPATGPADPTELALVERILDAADVSALALDILLEEAAAPTDT